MEGRGANLKKIRQQAESRVKTKPIIRTLPAQVVQPPIVVREPEIQNAAMFLEPINNPPPAITNPQELRTALTPMSPIRIDNINQEPEDPESGKFLASLIAQGAAGFGAGIMGGSSQDILRSTGMFDRMRESDINRQDRLRQNELLRAERLGEKQDRLSEIKKREDQAKLLTDPNSEESKKRREVYKSLGLKVSDNLSFTDLNDPIVLQSLRDKMQEQKLAAMPRGGIGVGGVGKPKEEKESKNQSDINKYTAEADSLRNQLIEYKKAVKAIPILGGAAQKANAEALQKDILLTIKNIKKTGSLDEGSIKVIEGMIGTADYTRGDIVDATINRSLQNLNKAVETELRGTGTKNTKYTPYIPYENPTPQEEEIIKNYYSDPNDPDNLKMYQTLRAKKGF
jgi:hypothetical protein